MKLAVTCTLPSLKTWSQSKGLPLAQFPSAHRLVASHRYKFIIEAYKSQSQRDVEDLIAPIQGQAVIASVDDGAAAFLEQVFHMSFPLLCLLKENTGIR